MRQLFRTVFWPNQISKGNLVQIIADDLVQPLPQGKRAACGHAGAGRGICLQTGNGRKGLLRKAQDAAYGALVGSFDQLIAAALSAQAQDKFSLDQEFDDASRYFSNSALRQSLSAGYICPAAARPGRS